MVSTLIFLSLLLLPGEFVLSSTLNTHCAIFQDIKRISQKKELVEDELEKFLLDYENVQLTFLGRGASGLVYRVSSSEDSFIVKVYLNGIKDRDSDFIKLKNLQKAISGTDFRIPEIKKVGRNLLIREDLPGETLNNVLNKKDLAKNSRKQIIARFNDSSRALSRALGDNKPQVYEDEMSSRFLAGKPDGTQVFIIQSGETFVIKSDNVLLIDNEFWIFDPY